MAGTPASSRVTGAGALTLIEEQILGVAGILDFQNIPGSYRALVAYVYARGDTAATFINLTLRFNADAGANYHREMVGATSGTAVQQQTTAGTEISIQEIPAASAPASYFGAACYVVPFYATTVAFKAVYADLAAARGAGATTQTRFMGGGLWLSTAAINRVQFDASTGDLVADSRGALYGIT